MASALDHIAKDLRRQAVPIESLHPHPENPRRGDTGAIRESLERFGQVRPVLALAAGDENELADGTIVAGHHVWLAARELGWAKIAAVREAMSDTEARAYLIADNRIPELATYDDEALASVLRELREDEGLAGTGFDDRQVESLLKGLSAPGSFPDPDDNAQDTQHTCPSCGYEWG